MSTDITYLPENFKPSATDVIVGRGKVCYKHPGNQVLNRMVQAVLAEYSAKDSTKKSKSELIKGLVAKVRDSSPDGGFVKFDSASRRWYDVGDRLAREKVSQTFRDALNDKYKSSTTSKTLRRRQERIHRSVSAASTNSSSSSRASSPRPSLPDETSASPLSLMASVSTAKLYQKDQGFLFRPPSDLYELNLTIAARTQLLNETLIARERIRREALIAAMTLPRPWY